MKKRISENYLTKIPIRNPEIKWEANSHELITLFIENRGVFNRLAQRFFKKPKTSQVHLDQNGSYAWSLIDGERDIIEIARFVDERFGEEAHPLYKRLARFFQTLETHGFISFKKIKR